MRDTTAFPTGMPQNNTRALRDDLCALHKEMGVLQDVSGLRVGDNEYHLLVVPLIRNLHERIKQLEAQSLNIPGSGKGTRHHDD